MKTDNIPFKSFVELEIKGDEDSGVDVTPKKNRKVASGSKGALQDQGRGVVYLSHIPHGFYEKEMFKFFSQFGSVTNIKMGRSKRTGKPRGYSFIEFRYHDVAKIVAETMNNYLMFEKLLKCKVVPSDEVKASMFKGKIDPRKPPAMKSRILDKQRINATKTEDQDNKRSNKLRSRAIKVNAKLAGLGIQLPVIEALTESPKKIAKTDSAPRLIKIDETISQSVDLEPKQRNKRGIVDEADESKQSLATPGRVKKVRTLSTPGKENPSKKNSIVKTKLNS